MVQKDGYHAEDIPSSKGKGTFFSSIKPGQSGVYSFSFKYGTGASEKVLLKLIQLKVLDSAPTTVSKYVNEELTFKCHSQILSSNFPEYYLRYRWMFRDM